MLLSLESLCCRRLRRSLSGGHASVLQVVGDVSAGRGRRTWANGNRGSPGTWEILPSPRKPSRTGIPGDQPQARRRPRATAAGAKRARSRGTAKRRKRSAAGGPAGSRSALIVPSKRGNNRPSGPRGGKRGIGIMDSLLGHTPDTWRFDERIHETATDSRAGETIAADGVHFAGLSDGRRLA